MLLRAISPLTNSAAFANSAEVFKHLAVVARRFSFNWPLTGSISIESPGKAKHRLVQKAGQPGENGSLRTPFPPAPEKATVGAGDICGDGGGVGDSEALGVGGDR